MEYFWEIVSTIKDGVGFNYFDSLHLAWILGAIIFISINSFIYRKCDDRKRSKMRKIFALLIILDELFKQYGLIAHGNWTFNDLPLHLCSINIMIITYHSFRPNTTVDNFLYAVCLPSAISAILAPIWTTLPLLNFMHIHSFTIHILLATYVVMLVAGKDIIPDIKLVAKALMFTCIIAIPIYGVNLIFNTNFMFLMGPEEGNYLLLFFEETFGFHLIGVMLIECLIILVLYTPFYVVKAVRMKNKYLPR